ncbi:hypothetical protein F2Q69_00060679 [Brassica cretica]|uniref:SURP motif domain-containing protein n=1 Tax=Brassica cretica TaxID=69181 RepID=A0A8S9RG97_BRACR|nr:hypothetical protein F2Q69_00060679 [Brassica cretica]
MSSATKNDVAHAAIIEPPPDVRRMLQKTARLVSERGLEMESRVMDSNKNDERFNFLKNSDPYHAFYKHKLTQYRNNPEDGVQEILNLDAPPPATTPQFMEPLPHPFGPPEFSFKPPQGITLKERAVIVLTAQVLMRIRRGACMAETLVKVFLEQVRILLEKQEQGLDMGHMAMGDLDVVEVCVVDYFTHLEEDQQFCTNVPPPRLHPLMGMIAQSRASVTEIQLIAGWWLYNLMSGDIHFQGSSRTSDSVPNVDAEVIARGLYNLMANDIHFQASDSVPNVDDDV